MPKKKEDVTKSNKIPKKIDNNENQETSTQKLGWVQILLLLGKPVWDETNKKVESVKRLSISIRKSK